MHPYRNSWVILRIDMFTYGNRCAKGEVALARLPTVPQTCKLQQSPVLGSRWKHCIGTAGVNRRLAFAPFKPNNHGA